MYALLVVQHPDEKAVLHLVLQRAGLAVSAISDLDRALPSWSEQSSDMILHAVDTSDPIDAIRRIRAETEVPVLMVAGDLTEDLHCELLEGGVDLVVSRPFSARLLISQVRALMRRAGGVRLNSLPNLRMADLTLDPATRTVEVAGRPRQRLTHLEFRLLYTLMIHRGHILSPDIIVERVWGYSDTGDRDLVRGLVRRLRAKVEPNPSCPRYILTEPRVGYSFVDELTS